MLVLDLPSNGCDASSPLIRLKLRASGGNESTTFSHVHGSIVDSSDGETLPSFVSVCAASQEFAIVRRAGDVNVG